MVDRVGGIFWLRGVVLGKRMHRELMSWTRTVRTVPPDVAGTERHSGVRSEVATDRLPPGAVVMEDDWVSYFLVATTASFYCMYCNEKPGLLAAPAPTIPHVPHG
jgi:hypothetical protein